MCASPLPPQPATPVIHFVSQPNLTYLKSSYPLFHYRGNTAVLCCLAISLFLLNASQVL